MEKSGNIHVVESEYNFKRINKSIIRELDAVTVGVYAKILLFGNEWQLNIKGLSTVLGMTEKKTRSYITILEAEGYIVRKAIYDKGKHRLSGWDYYVYSEPVPKEERTSAGHKKDMQVENADLTVSRQDCVADLPIFRQDCKPDMSENGEDIIYKPKGINKSNRIKKEEIDKSISKKKAKFDFRQAVIDLGVNPDIVDDWLVVRKNKRASNTETAFNRVKDEIAKSGKTANECIKFAVELSWQGFKANWMDNAMARENNKPNKPAQKTQQEINREMLEMPILNEDGDLPDGTFFKNGYRYYISPRDGKPYSVPIKAPHRPNDRSEYDYNRRDWYIPRELWQASDEIW